MAGRKAKVDPLVLITGDDFRWSYEWRESPEAEPSAWPAGYELYYEFKNGAGGSWTGGTKWHFIIAGSVASIRVESEVANGILPRTAYRLVLKDTNPTPTIESVLVIGNVERQEPK
ncbi:hypothetical protein AB0G00_24185 [Nocardia salmonicida]|uniref:LtfC-like domain-containing protein n=1 Tax=Nocardia salmonicida TaxID=53431 RepID=UPI0033F4B735